MNSFGRIFRINIWGESHGLGEGILIDGCPAGISVSEKDFIFDLKKRQSGVFGTTRRKEKDFPIIKSGIFNNKTTGMPILIEFENKNVNSNSYLKNFPRPGHADFTAFNKYQGFNDFRGGGHFSGRLTLGLVAAGTIAKKIIKPIEIKARILEIGGQKNYKNILKQTVTENNSLGGIIECRINKMLIGLGEPFFDSLESLISHAIFSIPAIKGIEFGSGFKAALMKGSQNNDEIISINGKTKTNNAGGINGGISNGNEIIFRMVVKPTSSIFKEQNTINLETGKRVKIKIKGRHDSCIALRMPVIVEAVAAAVLADLLLINK